MKQLIGGVAGALITGIAILGWNGHAASEETAWTDARGHGPVQLVSDRVATPAVTEDEAAPALRVTCEPGQRAVVRRAPAMAGATMDAGCVGGDDVATLAGVQIVCARSSRQAACAPCRCRTRRPA